MQSLLLSAMLICAIIFCTKYSSDIKHFNFDMLEISRIFGAAKIGNEHLETSKPQGGIQDSGDKPVDRPARNFEVIIQILDSLDYKSDTARVAKLKNYKELLDSEVQFFGNLPFYKVAKEKSKVLWWNKNARDKQDSIDTEIFREAENVWGYYY